MFCSQKWFLRVKTDIFCQNFFFFPRVSILCDFPRTLSENVFAWCSLNWFLTSPEELFGKNFVRKISIEKIIWTVGKIFRLLFSKNFSTCPEEHYDQKNLRKLFKLIFCKVWVKDFCLVLSKLLSTCSESLNLRAIESKRPQKLLRGPEISKIA